MDRGFGLSLCPASCYSSARMTVEILDEVRRRVAARPRRVVFARPEAAGLLAGVDAVRRAGIARPVLLGRSQRLGELAWEAGISLSGVDVIEPTAGTVDRYAHGAPARWRAMGVGDSETRERLSNPDELALAIVRAGDADAVLSSPVSGVSRAPSVVARVGPDPGCPIPADAFVAAALTGGRPVLVVNPVARSEPSAKELAEIALGGVAVVRLLTGVSAPHMAFLSWAAVSSLGPRDRYRSVADRLRERVRDAARTIRVRDETVRVDTEPHLKLAVGGPDLLVFSGAEAGDLSHRIQKTLRAVRVLGPIRLGTEFPANLVPAGAPVDDVVDMTAVTVLLVEGGGRSNTGTRLSRTSVTGD